MLNIIYCVDNSGLFGRKNSLPWSFKEDLKYFRDITTNFNKTIESDNIIVMGMNTWLSIGKKLPNRINVVISSSLSKNPLQKNPQNPQNNKEYPEYIYNTFDEFMNNCKINKPFYEKNIFVIGGKKLLSYTISKYSRFIKHVFINIIQHSFPQFLDDVVLKIYSFHNFELSLLSNDMIYCLNNNDGKYYYIKFNKYINNNYNVNDVLKFVIDNKNVNYGTYKNNNSLNQKESLYKSSNNDNHSNNVHEHYNVMENVYDIPLNYCDECDTIIKQPITFSHKCNIYCNNCIQEKCKCILC